MSRYKIEPYTGETCLCEDCEEIKNRACWLIIGAGISGYLYLCDDHKEQFEDDAEQDY